MRKRDTESAKTAPESVLSNGGESRRYALDQVFAGGGYQGGLSPYTVSYSTIRPYNASIASVLLSYKYEAAIGLIDTDKCSNYYMNCTSYLWAYIARQSISHFSGTNMGWYSRTTTTVPL